MAQRVATDYTYQDLDWLRDELGVAHLELDPWGSLIVTPASDEHEAALGILHYQAVQQLRLPPGCVRSNSFGWKIPGGSGYLNVPDLTVLAPGWRRIADDHTDPPPLLVVEVASRSTVRADRGRKLDDYRLGGAGLYVRVDFYDPGRAGFEVYELASGSITVATTTVDLVVGGRALQFDLSALPQG
jgi:Uma2 family endonuclease